MTEKLKKGISLRRAIILANSLGIAVEHVRRTGELRFTAADHHPVKVNGRRKDVSRTLARLLRDVEAERRGGAQ